MSRAPPWHRRRDRSLQPFLKLEHADQVARGRRLQEVRDRRRIRRRRRQRVAIVLHPEIENRVGRRIVLAARARRDLLARLRGDERPHRGSASATAGTAARAAAALRQHAARGVLHDARRHAFVGDAELSRAPRVDGLAGQQQVERRRRAGQPRQALDAAPAGTMPSITSGSPSRVPARRRRRDSGRRAPTPSRRQDRSRAPAPASETARGELLESIPAALDQRNRIVDALELAESSMSAPAMNPFSLPERITSPFGGSRGELVHAARSSSITAAESVLVDAPPCQASAKPGRRRRARVSSAAMPIARRAIFRRARPASRRLARRQCRSTRYRVCRRSARALRAGARRSARRMRRQDGRADRAAVDVELVVSSGPSAPSRPSSSRQYVVARPRPKAGDHLRGESLVDLPRVEVVEPRPWRLQDRRRRMDRPEPHLRGIESRPFAVDDRPEHGQLCLATASRSEDQPRRAVGDLRAVARGDVAVLAIEERLQLGKVLRRRIVAHAIVGGVELAGAVEQRRDLASKWPAFCAASTRAWLCAANSSMSRRVMPKR